MMVSKKGAISICTAEHASERSSSSSHSDAVALLAKLDKKLAKHLSILIGDKTSSHYGEKFIGIDTLKSCLRAMDQLVAWAMREII